MTEKKQKLRVMYVARFIPFYRGGVLANLAQAFDCKFLCQEKEFGVGRTPDLPEVEKKVMTKVFGRFDWLPTKRSIEEFKPDVVISELGVSFLTVFWLLLAKRLYGFRLAFWTHGLEGPRKEGRMWKSDFLRKYLLEGSDAVIYYTKGCEISSVPYLRGTKGYIAANTLDSEKLNVAWESVREKCESFQNRVVFIGRLVDSKRVRDLLELAKVLQNMKSSVRIQIAGEGPLEVELKTEVEKLGLPVDFVGPITSELCKAEFLGSALAGVCLGRVGLNIVDNICFGLPLITLKSQPLSSAHAPEIDYLVEGKTGWMCEDLESVAARVNDLEVNSRLRMNYQQSCRSYFKKHCQLESQLRGLVGAIKGSID